MHWVGSWGMTSRRSHPPTPEQIRQLHAWRPDRPLRCVCGYHRKGLQPDALCPECGALKLKWTLGSKIYAARRQAGILSRAAWRLTLVTAVLTALTLLLFLIMLAAALEGGGGAPIGLILPGMAWVFIIAPCTFVAFLLLVISAVSSTSRPEADIVRPTLDYWTFWLLAGPLGLSVVLVLFVVMR